MATVSIVRASAYADSVALLALARELRSGGGVEDAAALMATPANKELMARSGLLTAEARAAGPNDLVVVIRAASAADAERARGRAEALLGARQRWLEGAARARPRSLESARRQMPGANLALISVPGAFAAAEARRALRLGLHVMLFSDNVALGDEIALKGMAAARGLLLMGPDCGTAWLNGVPLGFANAVPRGRIGIVAASGTGLQQVATLLAAQGEGLSHAVGVGGRDMSAEVGGLMTLQALEALGADPLTELLIVIGKPPASDVRARIEAGLGALGKPCVVAVLGRGVQARGDGTPVVAATLEDAARAAVALLRGKPWTPEPFTLPAAEVRRRVAAERRGLRQGQRGIRALYAGGTLGYEAALIVEPLLGPVAGNLGSRPDAVHQVWDLGADEFTVGHAHPMLDPTARIQAIATAAKEPDVAVLLLDVVLGHGAAADPAGDIAPALSAARAEAEAHGRALSLVASVVGTDGDPQGLAAQIARLESAGVWVLPSNAQAARAAACIAGGDTVLDAVLGEARR